MPLFERMDRPRREVESGVCEYHPEAYGVATCPRCESRICANCRTRWHEENLCLRCVENSIAANEQHPRDLQSRKAQAIRGFVIAAIGAFLFLLGLSILFTSRYDPSSGASGWSVALMLIGVLPCVVGLGQGSAVVLKRGPLLKLATSTVVIASSQIGLTVGLMFLNFWRN